MTRITVYRFCVYDIAADASRLSPSLRTEAEIRRMRFEPILETAVEIDDAELDEDGRYHPPGGGASAETGIPVTK